MTLICGVPRNYGSGKEGADRPRRGKNESQPPFIRTPPAAACRSLFLSLLIKAKRFLLLPLKPGAPTSLGQRGGPAAAPSRDGPPRPHAAGHDPAGMAFKRREHLVGMALMWRGGYSSGTSRPPRKVSLGSCLMWECRSSGEGGGGRTAPAPVLVPHRGCSLGKRRRGALGGKFGSWDLKIPLCFHERGSGSCFLLG